MPSILNSRKWQLTCLIATILLLSPLSGQSVLAQNDTQTDPGINADSVVVPNYWDPSHIVEPLSLNARSVRFLASDDFPPFSFRNSQGNLIGFNVDLAREICRELDLSCSFSIRRFAGLERALERDEGDAIIAGISITEASRRRLLFSDPYLRIPGRFVVTTASNPILTPETMAGQPISVIRGTAHEAFLRQYFPNSEIAAFDEAMDAREALRSRLVAAHFSDALSLGFWLYSSDAAGCCMFAEGAWDDQYFFGPGLAIATKHENTDLIAAINYTFKRLYENGTYRELYYRYFPAGLY